MVNIISKHQNVGLSVLTLSDFLGTSISMKSMQNHLNFRNNVQQHNWNIVLLNIWGFEYLGHFLCFGPKYLFWKKRFSDEIWLGVCFLAYYIRMFTKKNHGFGPVSEKKFCRMFLHHNCSSCNTCRNILQNRHFRVRENYDEL